MRPGASDLMKGWANVKNFLSSNESPLHCIHTAGNLSEMKALSSSLLLFLCFIETHAVQFASAESYVASTCAGRAA